MHASVCQDTAKYQGRVASTLNASSLELLLPSVCIHLMRHMIQPDNADSDFGLVEMQIRPPTVTQPRLYTHCVAISLVIHKSSASWLEGLPPISQGQGHICITLRVVLQVWG